MCQHLCTFFAGRVRWQRFTAGWCCGGGVGRVCAINTGSRGEQEFFDVVSTAQLKQIQCTYHIGFIKGPGVLNAETDPRAGCKMDDRVKFLSVDHRPLSEDCFAIRNIEFMKCEAV